MTPDPSVTALILAASGERDLQLKLRLQAWRDGYAAAELAHADDYSAGLADGILARKRAQHRLHAALRQHLITWDGLRQNFGQPRPGDVQPRTRREGTA